jgi:hypothetical protein
MQALSGGLALTDTNERRNKIEKTIEGVEKRNIYHTVQGARNKFNRGWQETIVLTDSVSPVAAHSKKENIHKTLCRVVLKRATHN